MSRRQENVIDTPSRVVPADLPQAQAVSIDGNRKGNSSPDGHGDAVGRERMQHADLDGAEAATAGED